ncbi:MAG: sensor histidine kinase [Acidimicrobiales bacterium]
MRTRLALTAAAVTGMIVLAFCIPLGRLIQVVAANRALEAGKLESRSLAGAISAVSGQPETIAQLVMQADAGNARPLTVYLPDGRVLGSPIPVDPQVELARKGRSFTASAPGGDRDILIGVVGSDPNAPTVVRVRVPAELLHRGVYRAWAILAVLGLAVVAIAVALADRLARSIVVPMGDLLSVTRRLQRGDLRARVEPAGPPEVAEVGQAVNDLADRVGELLVAEREAAADLSHQLRTPLTVLRLDAEGLRSTKDRQRIAGDLDRLEQVVTRVIQESRDVTRRPGVAAGGGWCDLGQVVRHRLAFWSILATEQGRQLSSHVPDGPQSIGVSQAELELCLDALINNVFTHTDPGVPFWVEVIDGTGGQWALIVEDAGRGLTRSVVPQRGASGGSGTGLGLDIVRRTAESSGGAMSAGHSRRGGARVEVRFGAPAQRR